MSNRLRLKLLNSSSIWLELQSLQLKPNPQLAIAVEVGGGWWWVTGERDEKGKRERGGVGSSVGQRNPLNALSKVEQRIGWWWGGVWCWSMTWVSAERSATSSVWIYPIRLSGPYSSQRYWIWQWTLSHGWGTPLSATYSGRHVRWKFHKSDRRMIQKSLRAFQIHSTYRVKCCACRKALHQPHTHTQFMDSCKGYRKQLKH